MHLSRNDAIEARRAALIDAGLLLLLVACLGSVAADLGAVRAILVLAAAGIVPGWALLTRFPLSDLLTTIALAVAFSIGLEILGSLVLGWADWWHPAVLGAALAAGSAALLLQDLVSALRRAATDQTEGSSCP
jgi:uncharacterized membrane protein